MQEKGDVFTHYERGLADLLERLGKDHERYVEALTYEQRLCENIAWVRRDGDTENWRAERAQVASALNRLALLEIGTSFNELCGFRASAKRLGAPLDLLFTNAGLPPDMPLHERLANLLMISLATIRENSVAVATQLLALFILSGLFAWWLAQSEPCWADDLWTCMGVVWLGLAVLPLVAGFLPQRREDELYKAFTLTIRQRVALWLDKAFGIYVSAYLGEVTAIVIWLGLNYAGQWANLGAAGKVTFWLIMEWLTFTLAFVGAVIATKYWENLLQSRRRADLETQHLLLGLGFPLIILPMIMVFGLATASFWSRWQTGGVTIGLALLIMGWMLGHKSRRRPS